jgi:ribosomal-protein-alanine N-acetyltransferase
MAYEALTILETERLSFRPHILSDREVYCAMEMDAEVRRFVGGNPLSMEEAQRRFTNALKPVSGKLNMWATVFKPEGKYIGRCGIYPHLAHDGNTIPDEASLGLYMTREYWGRGLATEASNAFIRFGFEVLELTRIVALVQVGNDASVRVLKKLGFVIFLTEINPHGNGRSFYNFELKNPAKLPNSI